MNKKKILSFCKKTFSSFLCSTLLLTCIMATNFYYNYNSETAFAANLSGSGSGNTKSVSVNNIGSTILTDSSSGNVAYYFDGSSHKFYQLNADGASSATSFNKTGSSSKLTRELVGAFNATGNSAWGASSSSSTYALDVTSAWNGASNLAKATSVTTGGGETRTSTVFFPSYDEYNSNSTVAGIIYNGCGTYVWSRSVSGGDNAWSVYDSSGDMDRSSVSFALAGAPAFNLDLSKVLIARSASSGASATTSSNLTSFNANSGGSAVKFLAKTDGSVANISGISNGANLGSLVIGSTYSFNYSQTNANYLSAVIMDNNGTILYYGNLAKGAKSGTANITIPSGLTNGGTYYLGLFDETKNAAYYTDTTGTVNTYKFTAAAKAVTGATLVSDGLNGKTYTPGSNLSVGTSVTYQDVYNDGTKGSNATSGVSIKFGNNAAVTSVTLPTSVKGDYAYTLYKGSYSLGTGKIYIDYQTGIDKANATNTNMTNLSPGNKLKASEISVKYTSSKGTLNHIVGKGGNTSLIKLVPETDYSTSLNWNDSKLVSEIIIPGGTSGDYKYRYVVKNEYTDEIYASDSITVNVDSHEKVNVVNDNDENLSLGDSIYASSITASYEVTGAGIDANVSADDIYVIAATDWEGNEDKNNSKLAKEIKVPDDASGSFDYYVVIKDTTSAKGYWAAKYTVDCSENSTGFDETVWYSHTEDDIEWNYKLDKSGNIIGLYTTSSNLSKIVDEGGILNIPAVVNGRTVVKIGGGTESTPVIPSTAQGWTRLSLPSSVTTLNDFAFYQTGANAQVTIPSTVTAIGIKAFYQSNIKGVKLSGMEGTVGSYAFGKTSNLKTISITGDSKGLEISSVSFADTGATDVTIKGNVTLNQKAFRGNISLKSVTIDGNVNIGPGAFSGNLAITSLNINGNVNIGEYAFDGLSSLASLYLPEDVTLHAHSFEGLSSLTKLETETSLPALSFSNSGKIDTLILGENVNSISYDWEGHSSSVASRTVYIKNADTTLEFYGKDGTYYSSMGSSGNVNVYIPSAQKDLGSSITPDGNGILKINGDTARTHGEYDLYEKGTAQSVVFNGSVNVSEQIKSDNITSPKLDNVKLQTGIEAYYNGTLLTTNPDGVKVTLDKDKMTVNKMYGSEEGDSYFPDDFYVVKTSDYTKEASKEGGLTESAIAAYPAVQATNDDLSTDSNIGSLAVTVVVFYDNDGESAYYTAPVSVRIERYTDKTYIEQKYGSYEEITEAFMEYEKQIKTLQELLVTAGVDRIDELTQMLDEYKRAYAALTETLEEYVKNNNSSDNKYFGDITNSDGTVVKVVYINGEPTKYEDTGKTDKDGNNIYKVSYDLDKDGTSETIYIIVKDDGVYIVDIDGNPVKDDNGNDIVFKDTINALKRQLTAQLASLKNELDRCDSGLKKIKDTMQDVGIPINPSASVDDYTQIANGIADMKKRIDSLDSSLTEATQKVTDYSNAVSIIYTKLIDDSLTTRQAMNLQETLNAIINKIDVMKASNADLTNQVSNANSQISQLENQLKSTQDSLLKANADIAAAEKDKADLQTQYEKAIAEGNAENAEKLKEQMDAKDAALAELNATKTSLEQKQQDIEEAQNTVKQLQKQLNDKNTEIEKLKAQIEQLSNDAEVYKTTLDNINSIFGFSLKQGDDVDKALRDYVAAVLADRKTISDIQQAINSSSTGDALVSDVKKAIASGSGNIGSDDSAYKNGYNAGYKDGVIAASGNGNNSGNSSTDVNEAYANGYNAGYEAGSANNSGSGSIDTSYYDRQINSLNNKNSQLSDENNSLNERVSQLEDENGSLSDQVSSLSDENVELNSQIDALNGEVYTLKNENSQLAAGGTSIGEDVNEEVTENDTSEEGAVVTVSEEEITSEDSLTEMPKSSLTDLTDSVPISKVTFDSNLDNDADSSGITETGVTATEEKHINPVAAVAMGTVGVGTVGGLGFVLLKLLGGNIPFVRKKTSLGLNDIGLDDDIDVDVDTDDVQTDSDEEDEEDDEDDEDFDEFN